MAEVPSFTFGGHSHPHTLGVKHMPAQQRWDQSTVANGMHSSASISQGQHISNALAKAGFIDALPFAFTLAILLKTRSVGALEAGMAKTWRATAAKVG